MGAGHLHGQKRRPSLIPTGNFKYAGTVPLTLAQIGRDVFQLGVKVLCIGCYDVLT